MTPSLSVPRALVVLYSKAVSLKTGSAVSLLEKRSFERAISLLRENAKIKAEKHAGR